MEEKIYRPLRNERLLKQVFSLILFFMINIVSLILISTGYMKKLMKINSRETVEMINRLIKPVFSGQYMYLPFGNWGKLMQKTPKLTSDFQLKILFTFLLSTLLLTMPYWKMRKLNSYQEVAEVEQRDL